MKHPMHMLAFGTGSIWRKSGQDALDRTLVDRIKAAIHLGYTHLDTAELYGTEKEVGIAIEESKVPRKDLYITAKVNTMTAISSTFEQTLHNLGTDYVDMYLIHFPYFGRGTDEELQSAWAEMEKIKASGRARDIGVSNFVIPHLLAILATAKVKPAINHIEFHPYLQHQDLIGLHRKEGIATLAYSALSPLNKAHPGPVDSVVQNLAVKYGCSEAVILLRWCIDQNIAAVTTTTKEFRMADYLKVLDIHLEDHEVANISRLGSQKHFRGRWNDKFDPDDRS